MMILFQRSSKRSRAQRDEDVTSGLISKLFTSGLLDGLVEDYIELCHSQSLPDAESGVKKARSKRVFPNLAGLCRFLNTGLSDLYAFNKEYPEEYDRLLAIFEDEALNSDISPTLLSAYMKTRISPSLADTKKSSGDKEVRYCFEHDIFADGE